MTRGRVISGGAETNVALADRVLIGAEGLADPKEAVVRYARAASEGSGAAAARHALLAALGVGRTQSWTDALDLLLLGAELGDQMARRQLSVLAGRDPWSPSGQPRSVQFWRRVRGEINLDALFAPPRPERVFENPRIWVSQGFMPPLICRWLIKRSLSRLQRGFVNDAMTGETSHHPMRTARSSGFSMLDRDVVIAFAQERAALITGIHVHLHEPPNVISYAPGEQFEAHYDFVDPNVTHFKEELALLGQRTVTLVTYLNDGFEGAETDFPRLGWRFRGATGDAVVFYNIDAEGSVDPMTLHAGLPPTRGRKWVLSQWLRDKVQPLV